MKLWHSIVCLMNAAPRCHALRHRNSVGRNALFHRAPRTIKLFCNQFECSLPCDTIWTPNVINRIAQLVDLQYNRRYELRHQTWRSFQPADHFQPINNADSCCAYEALQLMTFTRVFENISVTKPRMNVQQTFCGSCAEHGELSVRLPRLSITHTLAKVLRGLATLTWVSPPVTSHS